VSTSVSIGADAEAGADECTVSTAFVLTFWVLCYAAVSGLVAAGPGAALIFVVLGIILGPSCLGLIEAGVRHEGVTVLSELELRLFCSTSLP